MRINKFVALATGVSRRSADEIIGQNKVLINGTVAQFSSQVETTDVVTLDGHRISAPKSHTLIMLNKPIGYVCSRIGQGSNTIYDLLPKEYRQLKAIGRLDKDSSGLLLLTDNGDLANELSHPRYVKNKSYIVRLSSPLQPKHKHAITETGVNLTDGISILGLVPMDQLGKQWEVNMHEGRNRQIRRTFEAFGYRITKLHRTSFGSYSLGTLEDGKVKQLETK